MLAQASTRFGGQAVACAVALLFSALLVLEVARSPQGRASASLLLAMTWKGEERGAPAWQRPTSVEGDRRSQLALLKQFELPKGQNDSYVSVCVSVKDEHCDIREWILYHAVLGIRKFYIFDTGSEDPVSSVLDDFIDSGLVEYKYITSKSKEIPTEPPPPGKGINWQLPIYNYCLKNYRERHRWMAFFDVDEFIQLDPEIPSVPKLLQRYEEHPGVVLHWQMYGPSYHFARPALGLLRSYTRCCPRQFFQHVRGKSFVQPKLTTEPRNNVHRFGYTQGHAVNTAGKEFSVTALEPGQEHLITYKHARLTHYISKSLEEFLDKIEKKGAAGNARKLEHIVRWARDCDQTCTQGVLWGQQLAARFDLRRGTPHRCRQRAPLPVLSAEELLDLER